MVNITPFKFSHMPMLTEMLDSQKLPHMQMKNLSKVGYIATLGKQPIAIGFLRRVEPCYGQIDNIVSYAYCGSILREEGLKQVLASLIEEAKRLKLKGITLQTQDKGLLLRAESLGFRLVSHSVLSLAEESF